MKKRITSTLLALLMLLPMITACSSDNSTDTETTAADTSAAETTPAVTAPGDALPAYDAKGADFTILGRDEEAYKHEFLVEAETGDTISDAVYKRNMAVEEKLNVKLTPVLRPGYSTNYNSFFETVNNSILAGTDDYQLVGGYTYRFASGTLNGSFLDWYTVEHIDLSQPWWSGGFTEAASIGNHAFIATGDLSTSYLQFTFAVFFNKALAASLGIENLYTIVNDGKWTFEKLNELGALAVSDINGDGKMDANDRFGYMTDQFTRMDAFLYALEVPLSDRDNDGIPYIIGVTDKYQQVIEAIYAMFNTSKVGFSDPDFDSHNMFEERLALFAPNRLYDAGTMRAMEDDFGIIPYPKWDEAQDEYHTYYSDNCTGFAVPITAADPDLVGIVTELMAAKSYEYVRPEVYDVALKTKYARDDESQEMIDMILESMLFDFTNIYAYSFGDQKGPAHSLRMLLRSNSTNLTSYFAEKESLYDETMKKLVSAVSGQ